jgi:predicted nucleic acid-binding protein
MSILIDANHAAAEAVLLLSYAHAIRLFSEMCATFTIEPLLPLDMQRMEHIMRRYADSRFDFTDTALMTLAERLTITRIATFDHRDFAQYRPTHAAPLTLLP